MGNEIGEGTHEQSEPEPVTHVLGLGPTFVTSLRLSFVSSVVPPLRSALPFVGRILPPQPPAART